MSEIRALVEQLIAAGVDPTEAAEIITRAALLNTPAQGRTARQDRNRRYYERRKGHLDASEKRLNMTVETASDAQGDLPPPKGSSPRPPSPKPSPSIPPSTPKGVSSPTPRQELQKVLDAQRAAAVVEHRQRIRKPLTARAAGLLADKFARCPEPNAAADAMIANGWQGFEPHWLEGRARPASTAPPERTVSDALTDIASGKWPTSREKHEPDYIETSYTRRS